MSRSTLAPAPAPATPAPSPAVSLDPVTGAVVSTPMACCTPPSKSSPSHLQPSTVTTHPPSDAYLTTVYSVLGLAVAAGLGYAAYRYYTDVYAANSRVAGLRGIVEKRAAYPVKEVADERLLDQAINEAQANLAPVSWTHASPACILPLLPFHLLCFMSDSFGCVLLAV